MLNIDKALEILHAILQTGQYDGDPDDSDALKLSSEGLKRIQACRKVIDISFITKPLPGESTD